MRKLRLMLAAFFFGAVMAAVPAATALACRMLIADSGITCHLVGEDDDNCYYRCYPSN